MDSPLLSAARGGRGHDGRSPGIAVLKEAFDITYAVHRMEEEGARRRKYNGRGGAGARGFLTGLNEDDEDDDQVAEDDSDAESDEEHHRQGGAPTGHTNRTAAGQQRQPHTSIMEGRAGQRDLGHGRVVGATGTGNTANTKSTRSRGKVGHKAFELDMDNATLLGRRRFGGAQTASSPLRMERFRGDVPATHLPPGSPMRI